MYFLKRHWLYVSAGLVVLLCVSPGVFLVWHANQPVETKTVYVMPEPNPERAEILKRITQPQRQVYAPKASDDEATDAPTDEPLDATGNESSRQESDFEDEDLESMRAMIDEETAEDDGDFPPVPEGFPSKLVPIWLSVPGYEKGDSHDHEMMYRVLIKLWNQGEHGFINGVLLHSNGKVYPLYPDVMYVRWAEDFIDNGDGNPFTIRYIKNTLGTEERIFYPEDFLSSAWATKFPGVKFIDLDDAGYDPESFLADE